jgi:hypothetical protein|tara:strand:+ start:526 stop:666 length:141 start_codon:yes stop_codon:yes gene_type:complete
VQFWQKPLASRISSVILNPSFVARLETSANDNLMKLREPIMKGLEL